MNPITIVGGGLAGLTLGIGLRQREIPVTIWEAGQYPRQKVCGEFISGRGLETLERLQLRDKIVAAGGRWATSAGFYTASGRSSEMALPAPALCISRFELDTLLAEEFRRLGGELRVRQRWTNGFTEPGVVRATGHRVQAREQGWRWFGLKVHVRGMELPADLELHFGLNGYVGLCRLADKVNLCGLFRTREPIHDLRQRWREILFGATNSVLHRRLANAALDETSFQSVAGLSFVPRPVGDETECALGDALTMIPPATGNGMSIALECAELALEPVTRYGRAEMAWEGCRRQVAELCRRRLESRLQFAARLHTFLLRPVGQRTVLELSRACPAVLRFLFTQTR